MGDPSGSPFFIGATMFNIQEKHTLSGDLMHETRTQDVTNLLKYTHEAAQSAPSFSGEAAWRHVGEIPMVIYEQWLAECGAAAGSHEAAAYVKQKLQSGEFSKFLVKGY